MAFDFDNFGDAVDAQLARERQALAPMTQPNGEITATDAQLQQMGIEVPLAPARPVTSPTTQAASNQNGILGTLLSSIPLFGMTGLGATATSAVTSDSAPFKLPSVTDAVIIVLGVVLVAGAVFGFKNAGSVVINTAKTGARAVKFGADLAT